MARFSYEYDQEKLKTKDKFKLRINGKSTSFLAVERFKNGSIRWYPFRYFPEYKKPEPKYSKIKFIGTNYGKIPSVGFSNSVYRGFGFTKPQGVDYFFRYLEENIKSPLTGVIFTKDKTELNNALLFISVRDFGQIRRRTKSFTESMRKDQSYLHQTLLNELLPKEVKPPSQYIYTEGSLERFMSKYAGESVRLNTNDIESIINKLDVEKQAIISTKKIVDKVYIEEVLREFDELIQQKTETKNLEEKWHQFFKRNPWIFSSVFSYPALYFKDKFNVSGHNLSGSPDKIIDFLIKNKLTHNIAFIEIKTHKTILIQEKPYRRPDIYSVSKDVSGAIVQVIDHRTHFLKNYHSLKGESGADSLNSKCLIIIGSLGSMKDKNKRNSFELFRLSNKDVEIITFDELKNKMEALLKIFTK